MKVSEQSERELVARIRQQLPPAPSWLAVGIGDDAAVVEPERNRLEVLTVDAVIDGVHFDRRFTPPDAIGHRALAVNLSDLAAMGALPRMALLSFALPSDLPCSDFDGIDCVPVGLEDVSKFPNLTRALLEKGYSAGDIRKIYGGNFLRVMRAVEKNGEKKTEKVAGSK